MLTHAHIWQHFWKGNLMWASQRLASLCLLHMREWPPAEEQAVSLAGEVEQEPCIYAAEGMGRGRVFASLHVSVSTR